MARSRTTRVAAAAVAAAVALAALAGGLTTDAAVAGTGVSATSVTAAVGATAVVGPLPQLNGAPGTTTVAVEDAADGDALDFSVAALDEPIGDVATAVALSREAADAAPIPGDEDDAGATLDGVDHQWRRRRRWARRGRRWPARRRRWARRGTPV